MSASAAEVYDELFVPALFADWADVVVEAAAIAAGDRVLDVACGTGIAARRAAARGAEVVGLDASTDMLGVAKRHPGIQWQHGRAEELPFPSDAFDAVVSQFGLMFFDDRVAGLREMRRVLRPGGRLVVAVWGALEDTPGYAAMADILDRLFGPKAAASLRVPYALGEEHVFAGLVAEAGIDARVEKRIGKVRFGSIEEWVYTDVRGWTLAGQIDDAQYAALLDAAKAELAHLVRADGVVEFAGPALLAVS